MFLECLFDELAVNLGVLFDRRQPHSLVFPSPTCISAVLEQLNSQEFRNLWDKDEMIGWIYQFFNSDDERKEMRKKSSAPRNTRELAVRNQFFTPRYVVQFLTDNTLGRTWYEMRHGHTSLLEQMDYFVRHEHEGFFRRGQQPQPSTSERQDLSKEELLQTQVQIAYRPQKDPRDIKLLDPACGSGHFLLYSFDYLETIYVEAWARRAFPALHSDRTHASRRLRQRGGPAKGNPRTDPPSQPLRDRHRPAGLSDRGTSVVAEGPTAVQGTEESAPAIDGDITRDKHCCADPCPARKTC